MHKTKQTQQGLQDNTNGSLNTMKWVLQNLSPSNLKEFNHLLLTRRMWQIDDRYPFP